MAARSVTARELLDIREGEWRSRVAQVSLVTELDDIDSNDSTQVVEAFGRIYQKSCHDEQAAARLLQNWPAAQVIGMSGFAAVGYRRGNFWSGFWQRAGVRGRQIDQQLWGTSFLANLRQLGLPDFTESDDVGTQYVGRILMHAGIPTYCLGDFFRLCVERRRLVANLEAESFIAWAADRAKHGRLTQVDKPVSRFLTHGGSYAVDLVDRSFELLDRLSARHDVSDFGLLPRRFVDFAAVHVASGELNPVARCSVTSKSTASSGQPFLKLDPWGGGVFVQLPAVGDMPDGSATWVVTVDGQPGVIRSRPLWPGAAEQAPETSFLLRRPARDVVVSLQGYERHEYALSVLGDDRMMLAFDEDGRSVPEGLPLPSGPVWLVYPDSMTPRIDGAPHLLATGHLPVTWAGWSVELWDLTRASAVMVGQSQRRLVRSVTSVRLNLDFPISGVRTAYGSMVYASPPTIELPADTSSDVSWQITVNRVGDELPLARRQGSDGPEFDRIWNDLPRPLLGAFDMRVRGPLGRGAKRRAFIAEGLEASCSPPWRRFDRGGLVASEVLITSTVGMSFEPSTLTLGPRETCGYVTVSAGEESEPLTIEPPHMTVAFESI